tara:strand:+ start:167 stop:376 length:210 start_codon:yes stop_codon:yes gene_type:complete
MAIKCKVFIHEARNLASSDGDADGKLAEDVQDYVSTHIGTADITTQLNISSTMIQGGSQVMTLVLLEAN